MHSLQDLVRLHRRGLPARAIARLLRMGRNTVTRYAEVLRSAGLLAGDPDELPELSTLRKAVEGQGLPKLPRQQRSSIERWLPIIDAKHAVGAGPTAIFDFLRLEHEDFEGSLASVKRRCAALRRSRPVRSGAVAIRVGA